MADNRGVTTASKSSVDHRMVLVIAALLGCALFGRFVFLVWPFPSDGAMFVYQGKLVAEGGRLCHDLVDNKFPTVGMICSVAWRAMGTWWPGYVLLQTAIAFGGAALLARSAKRHFGRQAWL